MNAKRTEENVLEVLRLIPRDTKIWLMSGYTLREKLDWLKIDESDRRELHSAISKLSMDCHFSIISVPTMGKGIIFQSQPDQPNKSFGNAVILYGDDQYSSIMVEFNDLGLIARKLMEPVMIDAINSYMFKGTNSSVVAAQIYDMSSAENHEMVLSVATRDPEESSMSRVVHSLTVESGLILYMCYKYLLSLEGTNLDNLNAD